MARYLITGGSGFLGQALIERLKDDEIVVIARDEGKLVELKQKFPKVEIIIGDVADSFVWNKVGKVDGVFHLAALKHIGLAEENVLACIRSNIFGTLNLLAYSINLRPKFVLAISTDKAARVTGVYGATKFLLEKLFLEYEKINKDTKYRTVRYGNVLYSTGSVLCKWKELIEKGEKIIVTDMDSTRFYWTVDEAVDLIFDCLENAKDAHPHYTPMKAIKMEDLVNAMLKKYGEVPVEVIGLQPGENKHEKIFEGIESDKVERYTEKEVLKLI